MFTQPLTLSKPHRSYHMTPDLRNVAERMFQEKVEQGLMHPADPTSPHSKPFSLVAKTKDAHTKRDENGLLLTKFFRMVFDLR